MNIQHPTSNAEDALIKPFSSYCKNAPLCPKMFHNSSTFSIQYVSYCAITATLDSYPPIFTVHSPHGTAIAY